MESWIQYKFENREWNDVVVDFKTWPRYQARLPAPSYINLDYRSEFHRCVNQLPRDKRYALLFSGGYDSALSLYALATTDLKFDIFIGRYFFGSELINERELRDAFSDCKKLGLPYQFIDVDVLSFLQERRYEEYFEIFPTWHIERYIQLLTLEKVPKSHCIINSAGDPNLVLEGETWSWVDRSCALQSWYFARTRGLDFIPHFLSATPELGASLLLSPILREQTQMAHKNGASFDFDLKRAVFRHFFPEVPARDKVINSNKFENPDFKTLVDKAHQWLAQFPYSRGREIRIPYSDILGQEWGKEYSC